MYYMFFFINWRLKLTVLTESFLFTLIFQVLGNHNGQYYVYVAWFAKAYNLHASYNIVK